MGISDITGVFSRYFIVGFFIPAFFSLALLKLVLSDAWVPKAVEADSAGSFLVLGAVALLIGLVLLGLRDPILYLLSGYFFVRDVAPPPYRLDRRLGHWLRARQLKSFEELRNDLRSSSAIETERRKQARLRAQWLAPLCFPNAPEKVLPTRIGNRIRAWEDYARVCWSLETTVVRPRVATFFSEEESKLHADAETDVAFFVNGAVGLTLAGVAMATNLVVDAPHPVWLLWVYVVPFLLAYCSYRAAVGAAERWGEVVCASIDVHRFDLYEKLGVRAPKTIYGTTKVGIAINRMMLYREPLPDDVRALPKP